MLHEKAVRRGGALARRERGAGFTLIEPLTEGKLKHSTPIACDRIENHGVDQSINVLYPNGRVELLYEEMPRFTEAIDKTTE